MSHRPWTAQREARLERLLERATAAPWGWGDAKSDGPGVVWSDAIAGETVARCGLSAQSYADAELIATMRDDIEDMLVELRALRARSPATSR